MGIFYIKTTKKTLKKENLLKKMVNKTIYTQITAKKCI